MGFNTSGAIGGATSGASAGSVFGPWGAAAGGVLGGIYGGFSGSSQNVDPSKGAIDRLNQIPGQTAPYYNPSINAGNAALPKISGQFDQLTNDPGGKLAEFGRGYQQSPGYQWSLNQGEAGINNAAAANGLAGTNQHQQNAGELATNLSNQDYYNYLNHVIALYGQGLSGNQDLYKTGTESSRQYADLLANNTAGQAAYDYAGAAGQNASNAQQQNNIYSGLGAAATAYKNMPTSKNAFSGSNASGYGR